jgi:predicted signal transduction protein with EAL and GGDEF domain
MSFGLAIFPQHGGDSSALLHAADVALYQAKRNGRNRVELSSRAIVAPDANIGFDDMTHEAV